MMPLTFSCFTIHYALAEIYIQSRIQTESKAPVIVACNYPLIWEDKSFLAGLYEIIKQNSKDKKHFTLHLTTVNAIMGE